MIDEPQTYTVSSYELSLARNKSVSFYRVVEHDFFNLINLCCDGSRARCSRPPRGSPAVRVAIAHRYLVDL
jgi:hypothetical protein